ncbi:MAG TPA: hypothetical protein VG291_13220 [Xanthobacteraceae bacterium]|nr:hypothetical protein [Xanthobacteraceae bacterium]
MPTHNRLNRVSPGSTAFLVRHADALLYGAVIVLLVAPFFVFDTIPLYDLPNHIARQHLLFDDATPGIEGYYEAHWRLIPNLALEGAVFLLHHVLPIDLSVRILLALTVAQLFLGTLALHYALFGRCGRLPLAAALFAYTGPLLFGFVNFCFGLGWVLWVFALWLRWRERTVSIAALGLLAAIALLAHLFAFCIYALLVVSCWAGTAVSRRCRHELSPRAIVASGRELLHLAVPATLYLAAMPHESAAIVPIYWDGWQEKVAALGSLLGFSDPILDWLCLFALAAGAIVIAPRVTITPQMRWPLAALTIAFLALPHRLGQATFVDYRVPLCIMLFLIGSTTWRNPVDPWRDRVAVLTCSLLALRLGFLYPQWTLWQGDYATYRAAFELLPPGAKLLPLEAEPGKISLYDHPPLGHVAALAVTQRGVLIPTLFADSDHQLLSYKPAYAALSTATPTIKDAGSYDYILLIRPERFDPGLLPSYRMVARGRTFILGRLRPDG